jgi:hypothetical protein
MTVRVCAPQVEPLRVHAIGARLFPHAVTPCRDATERREAS